MLVPRWIKDTSAWSLAQDVKNEGFTSIVVCALIQRGKVLRGPFKGMRLKESFGSVLPAKIIGTYELELQKAVQDLVERKPKIAFVIGAAEGYYAVGLARACESIFVYAWEADARARTLLENTARMNGVEITVRGVCTSQELLECAIGSYPDVIICDIEGAEIELFTEEVTAALNKTSFIIETHRKEENKELLAKFSKFFDICLVSSTPRGKAAWPLHRWIPCAEELRHRIMDEGRVRSGTRETPWIVAMPRAQGVLE